MTNKPRPQNFESILLTIYRKYISLLDDNVKKNTKVMNNVTRSILKEMKKDALFAELYNRVFYGGSYFDGLKVGRPDEFDLDFLLKVPTIGNPVLEHTNKPGYLSLKFSAPNQLSTEFQRMLDDKNYLSAKKVRDWMKSVFARALNNLLKNGVYKGPNFTLHGTTSESGPAVTLKLKNKSMNIDIDFVPCFEFNQWLQAGYKENPFPHMNTFFIVPKSPKDTEHAERYWRLSFQEQERQLIHNKQSLKPILKLFKLLRDEQQHELIESYYIKTIFLLENEKNGSTFWNASFTNTFFRMLDKYIEYIENDNIPYFWNEKNNLLHISNSTRDNLVNCLRVIQKDLLSKYRTEPLAIGKYLGNIDL